MKAVVDRIVQYANRYQLTNVETGEVLGTFDFEEVTGTVQQVGTEIDAELFDSIANDLAARVKLSGGELKDTVVTFSDISGTAANVASGDTSATLWGKVKNWFSRLRALAFKNKVAAGDFEAGAIKNADVAADAAIAQSKVSGLMTDYVASISVSGRTVTYKNKNGVNMGSITTQDTTYGLASPSSNGLMSATDKTKLDGIESGAQKNTVLGVKGSSESAYRTGNVNITKANIGLGNVDNTSDEDKPVSTATQTALNGKANTSGTYPNMTVGKATNADNAANATNATVHSVALIPSNADLNTYRGENYWGKAFYAGGNNTVQNTPIAGIAFSLEVLRSGSFSTTQRITMMAAGANNQPTVYTRNVSDTTIAGGEGTWTAWTEVAEANGTYPNMSVGTSNALSSGNFDKMYFSIDEVSSSFDTETTMDELALAMKNKSFINAYVGGNAYPALLPEGLSSSANYGSFWGIKYDAHRAVFYYSVNAGGQTRYFLYDWNRNQTNAPWEEIALIDKSYPTLGAGYLAKRRRLQTNSAQQGWLKIGTALTSAVANYQCYNCIMLISGVCRGTGATATAPKTAIVEFELRRYASTLGDTRIGILAGDIPADSLCLVVEDNLDASYYIYNNDAENIDIQFEILSEELSNKTPANIFEFSADDTALPSAPSGAQYAVVRNNASGDEDGNNIKKTYAKKNGTYPNMTVGNSTNATNADNATHATSADSATSATTASNLSGLTSYRSTINLSTGQVTSDITRYRLSVLALFGGRCIGAIASVDDGRATSFLIGRNTSEVIAFFDESNNGVRFDIDGAHEYGNFNMSGELTLNIVILA